MGDHSHSSAQWRLCSSSLAALNYGIHMDGGHGEREPGENGEGIKSQHQGFQTLKDVMSTQLKLFIEKRL